MATDITTLAIQLQSREAEASLKTFNELLEEGSRNAKRMERVKIGVDVSEALKELSSFKTGFDDIAKSAANIHFDLGMFSMPNISPNIETTALEELKTFFRNQADDLRKQSESMRFAGESAGEYANNLRVLHTAMRELDAATAKADAAMRLTVEADNRAAEAKRNLTQAEIELKRVSEQLNATHTGGTGDIMKLATREEELRGEVQKLSEAYKVAQAEADKLAAKLDLSAGKADEARARYAQLKASLDEIPAPAGKMGKSVDAFSVGAKKAGTAATKLARGFNAIAFAGGAAIPGLSKLGAAISMFAYSGPYVGAAVLGVGALAATIKNLCAQSDLETQRVRENAERAMQSARAAREFVSESEADWKRLGDLSNMGSLTNEQNREATVIIQRLTDVYGALGIEIDKATGKLTGYAEARAKASERDAELQRETLRHAKEMAKINAINQVKSFYNSSGDSFVRARNQEILSTLTDKALSDSEKQKAINLYKERLQRVVAGMEKMTYQTTSYQHTEGSIYQTTKTFEISKSEAAETLKHVEKLETAWNAANKAKRDLEKFDTREIEEYSKEAGKIARTLLESERMLVSENGIMRLKTGAESYQEQKSRISEIGAEIERVNKKITEADKGELAILDNGKQAGLYLIELQTERNALYEKTLTYEQRITAEKAKQREALDDAIKAEQTRLSSFKSGYILNATGAIVRKKNTDELAQDRAEEIRTLRAFLGGYNGGYGETLEDQKDVVAAQLKLTQLQAEQLKYRDQLAAADKQSAIARKGYVFDSNGSVIRKKTEAELQQIQAKEIEAAREQLKATGAGTLERAQAQAELDRLAIEAYNMRKKTGAAAAYQEARAENTRLVRGIEARSSEALALEARTFRRDDNKETEILKQLESGQKSFERNVIAELKQIGDVFLNLQDKIRPL